MRACEAAEGTGLSRLIRIVIALLLAYALARGAAVRKSYEEAEIARRELRSEVQMLREETEALKSALETEPEDSEIEKLARERLGLVLPDETIFYFAQAEAKEGEHGIGNRNSRGRKSHEYCEIRRFCAAAGRQERAGAYL